MTGTRGQAAHAPDTMKALCDQLLGQLFAIPKGGFLSITTEDGFGQVAVQADLVDGSGLPNSDTFSTPADTINNIGPFDGLCSQQLSVCVFRGDNPRAHAFTVKDAGTFPDSARNQIKITFTVQELRLHNHCANVCMFLGGL
jgi:hypothetical protein